MAGSSVWSGHERLDSEYDPGHQRPAGDVGQPVQRDVQHRDREHPLESTKPARCHQRVGQLTSIAPVATHINRIALWPEGKLPPRLVCSPLGSARSTKNFEHQDRAAGRRDRAGGLDQRPQRQTPGADRPRSDGEQQDHPVGD